MSAATTPQWKWEDWFLVALIKKIIPTVLPAKVVYMPEESLQPHCKERGKKHGERKNLVFSKTLMSAPRLMCYT